MSLGATGPVGAIAAGLLGGWAGGEIGEGIYVGIRDALGAAGELFSPLVLDLDGDGVELTHWATGGAYFDLDADGLAERSGWVTGGDGLLAFDRDGDGLIGSINELFGNGTTDGFTILSSLDSSGDGVIDHRDAEFLQLLVWKDVNEDGYSDQGELFSLPDLGVASIDLGAAQVDVWQEGNHISHVSSFAFDDGRTGEVVDAWFGNDQTDSVYRTPFEVDVDALWLPQMRGHGDVVPLLVAMSADRGLLDMVAALVDGSHRSWAEVRSLTKGILVRWAGTHDVPADGRGLYIDARELATLEAFVGLPFSQRGNPNPMWEASEAIHVAFNGFVDDIALRLMLQGPLADRMPGVEYNVLQDGFVGQIDADAAIGAMEAGAPAEAAARTSYWSAMYGAFARLATTFQVAASAYDGKFDAALARQGVVLDKAALRSTESYYGTNGSDLLVGSMEADLLNGGAWNDVLRGGAGSDRYLFWLGHGQDRIEDFSAFANHDAVEFGPGIGVSDLRFSFADGGNDLVISLAGTDDSLTLDNQMVHWAYWVERFRFFDETVLDRSDILAIVFAGSPDDDVLYGDGEANAIHGDAGRDGLYGRHGNDVLDGGEGDDLLEGDVGDDTLLGGAGADVLTGGLGADLLDGGGGDDVLDGAGGRDLYRFGLGHGADVISEFDAFFGHDAVAFGPGIGLADLRFSFADGGNDLVISLAGTNDRLTLDNQLAHPAYQVEEFRFADGTSIGRGALLNRALAGTEGDDTLYGDGGGNTFAAAAGNDLLVGQAGADRYVFGVGHGQDRVHDSDIFANDDRDAVALAEGIAPEGVVLSRAGADGRDLRIGIVGTTDTLTILDQFLVATSRVEEIRFADGTVWGHAEMMARSLIGTAADETFQGFAGADRVEGRGGGDVLHGNGGDDRLLGGDGDDRLFGGDGNDLLEGGDGDDLLQGGAGFDAYDGGAGTDTLDLGYSGVAWSVDLAAGLAAFATGAETLNSIENVVGGSGADALLGDGASNRLEGGAGNDALGGGAGSDRLLGGAGDDLVEGGEGADELDGGAGTDTLSYAGGDEGVAVDLLAGTGSGGHAAGDRLSGFENVTGSVGDDLILGDGGANRLDGGAGDDRLEGRDGDDRLLGGDGDDVLVGGTGLDHLDGGAGNDTADFAYSTAAWRLDLAAGEAVSGTTREVMAGFENLVGGSAGDTLLGDAADNRLRGGGGDDVLRGGEGTDTAAFAGARAGYVVLRTADGFSVRDRTGAEGTDALVGIERLAFSDGEVDLAGFSPPEALDSRLVLPVGASHAGRLPGIDRAGTPGALAFELTRAPARGSLSLAADGSFAFAAAPGFEGEDSFTYLVTDADGWSASATVRVTTKALGDWTPVALADQYWRSDLPSQADYWMVGPSIAPLSNGNYVVAWARAGADGLGDGALGRVFDARGRAVGNEFRLNTATGSDQSLVDVAGLPDGRFVAVWTSQGQDGSFDGIYRQVFAADGTKLGAEVRVNATTADRQRRPSVAATGDGGYVVAWESWLQDGSAYGIYARRYAPDGTASAEFRVNSHTADWQYRPQVVAAAGGFVVVWNSDGQDMAGSAGVYGQRFDGTGAPVGAEFRVNAFASGQQVEPRAVALAGGGFAVVWEDTTTETAGATGTNVAARVYGADGQAVGDQVLVNAGDLAGNQIRPDVAALPGGGFVVVWGSGADKVLRGQSFDAAGLAVGGHFSIKSLGFSEDWRPGVSVLADGTIAVAWQETRAAGDYTAVYTRSLPGPGHRVVEGGAGDDVLIGTADDQAFRGGGGNDDLRGAGGADSLSGGAGDDVLEGGAGSDTYLFARGDGRDRIVNAAADAAAAEDRLLFGADVAHDQLWFRRAGDDLSVGVLGTGEEVTLASWYADEPGRLDAFVAGDGRVLASAQVAQLVSAMAGFAPPSGPDLNLPPGIEAELRPTLAASWQAVA